MVPFLAHPVEEIVDVDHSWVSVTVTVYSYKSAHRIA